MASVRSVDAALQYETQNGFTLVGDANSTRIPVQGNLLRNIIEGSDLVMSHILHFYHLAALDYINTDSSILNGVAPWGNGKDNTTDMVTSSAPVGAESNTLITHYVQALDIRRKAHEMAAYVDGKHPCQPAFIPGGVTKTVDANLKDNLLGLLGTSLNSSAPLANIRSFIKYVYIPDVKAVAGAFASSLLSDSGGDAGTGCKNYLAYGTFPNSAGVPFITGGFVQGGLTAATLDVANIKEYVGYSFYNAACDDKHPSAGVTIPQPGKSPAYSWLKAPRYNGNAAEVGPLARVIVNYCAQHGNWKYAVDSFLTSIGLTSGAGGNVPQLRSLLGRHAARAIECNEVADEMVNWINALTTTSATGQTYRHRDIPRDLVSGYGLTEAPRGALGHWITINGKKIASYQCVVPTTWNACPKDTAGIPGPMEWALTGFSIGNNIATSGLSARVKVGRIVRSFDPCIACAVHIVTPDKKEIVKFELPTLPSK